MNLGDVEIRTFPKRVGNEPDIDMNSFDSVSRYIKGLEDMLAENAKTINQHEELLALQQSEIEYFKDEVEHLTRLDEANGRVIEDYESDIEKLDVFIDELRSQIEDLEYELSNERR
jgi:chromosome segregation ATPase